MNHYVKAMNTELEKLVSERTRRQMAAVNVACTDAFVKAFHEGCKANDAGNTVLAESLWDKSAMESPEIWFGLSSAATKSGDAKEAMQSALRCLKYAKKPLTRALCYNNIGMNLGNQGKRELAEEMIDKGLAILPNNAELIANKGLCEFWRDKDEQALALVEKALRLNPRLHQVAFVKALIHLVNGDYKRGWTWYESRLRDPDKTKQYGWNFGKPAWDGCLLRGRRLFIYCEQGAGDSIQFLRYARMIREQKGLCHLSLAIQPGLEPIARRSGMFDYVYEKGQLVTDDDMDFHIPLMSLGRIFGTEFATVPWPGSYIETKESRALPGAFRAGICWAGSPDHRYDSVRSTRLAEWEPVLKVPGVTFYSLQVGGPRIEVMVRDDVTDLADSIKDYEDTTAIIAGLDLVITVDTSVAHLAGAMGKPVWMLCSRWPDWRWRKSGRYSPWYPTMEIFRQETLNEWGPVFEEVAGRLRDLVQAMDSTAPSGKSLS